MNSYDVYKGKQWTFIEIEGYKLNSDELEHKYVWMCDNLELALAGFLQHHGWDGQRTEIIDIEFCGTCQ